MRSALLLLLGLGCATESGSTRDPDLAVPPDGSRLLGVFVGKVPCRDCERVKIELVLHERTSDGAPSAYVLDQIFVGKGDDRTTSRGAWTASVGTPDDPNAVIYRLDGERPAEFSTYRAVGPNILLLLDDALAPRVGNEIHSFTLSRGE